MLVFSADEEDPKKWNEQTKLHSSAQEECAERKETQRSNEDSGQRSEFGRGS